MTVIPPAAFRRFFLVLVATVAIGISPARAQQPAELTGTIEGTVSTQNGSVKLPGVLISIRGASDGETAQFVSNDVGEFAADLPPARYRVRASLDGFQSVEGEALVEPGGLVRVALDLPIVVSEQVDVVAKAPIVDTETLASSVNVKTTETQLIAPGQGVQAALRLMSGVILMPTGGSIDGGRPFQAGVQLGAATLVNPADNLARLSLPSEGIDSVSVLPNPYEVEFGRFSSGLVVIQTRRAEDRWRTRLSTLEPALRVKRFTLLDITGLSMWQPSVEVGGPIVKGRLYLDQSFQYHYQTTDYPSRPETELMTTNWLSSFTRADANLSPRHSLVVAGGFVPSRTDQAMLGTFVPPDSTVDVHDFVGHGMVTERALLGAATSLETTLEVHRYRTDIAPQGAASMELLPETTLGNFFNIQHRDTTAYQWIESVTHSHQGFGGLHVIKAGVDLLHSSYDGTSDSRTILIDRSNGTLARRLDFTGPSVQQIDSTDVAAYVQDRLKLASRWSVEFGGRFDYDGIVGRSNGTPRVGFAWQADDSGTAVVHGGYGLFFERTPSVAGVFPQFEAPLDTRFASDGLTPLGPAVQYAHVVAPNLQSARSSTWDLGYDHRVNRFLSFHAGVLNRESSHQLLVEPVVDERGGQYVMSSTGRSVYRQEEIGVHLVHGTREDLNASYVHSSAHEDLNTLLSFFDDMLQPIIGANAYAPAMADAPNRLLVRGRVLTARWLFLATADWRSGLPYSLVNEDLEFVGPRNQLRFPTYFRVDTAFERRLGIGKVRPWLGLGISNALNSFLPADVQANVGSPALGDFYNSVWREYRIRLRFEK